MAIDPLIEYAKSSVTFLVDIKGLNNGGPNAGSCHPPTIPEHALALLDNLVEFGDESKPHRDLRQHVEKLYAMLQLQYARMCTASEAGMTAGRDQSIEIADSVELYYHLAPLMEWGRVKDGLDDELDTDWLDLSAHLERGDFIILGLDEDDHPRVFQVLKRRRRTYT